MIMKPGLTAPDGGDTLTAPPVVLTIAGSDSSGGAGIQADLRAITCLGAYGATVLTAITAQAPGAITAVQPLAPEFVHAQFEAVTAELQLHAAKTGMLHNAAIIRTVADDLRCLDDLWLVVDPVMVATSGARLLEADAIDALELLLPLAQVMTPNLPEAAVLLNRQLNTAADRRRACCELAETYCCWCVLKGGHDPANPAADLVSDGDSLWQLQTPSLNPPSTHGTGCSLSAAIAAGMAADLPAFEAICRAKAYVYGSLLNCVQIGMGTWALGLPRRIDSNLVEVSCLEP